MGDTVDYIALSAQLDPNKISLVPFEKLKL